MYIQFQKMLKTSEVGCQLPQECAYLKVAEGWHGLVSNAPN
jgi:hypothetical protein